MTAPRTTWDEVAPAVSAVVALVVDLPTGELLADMRRASDFGMFLDPTAYRAALDSGRLDRNTRVLTALHAFAQEMRALRDETTQAVDR